jgi:hypothetical protein
MPLACLEEITDPYLIGEVFYLHRTYSSTIPDVAKNYVASLRVKRCKAFRERSDSQRPLSNGLTSYEVINQRCNHNTFVNFPTICKGLNDLDKKRISWTLCKMVSQRRIQRVGKPRYYEFRLT